MIVQLVQVYLVTGGSPLSSAGDTTELLVHGDNSWTSSGRLPTPRTRLRGATINNKIVVTGRDVTIVTWSSCANQFMLLFITLYFSFGKRLNLFFFSGGQDDNGIQSYYEDVLEFDDVNGVWNNIGKMRMARTSHAVSMINFNKIQDYCN